MRLDHLLSKEMSKGWITVKLSMEEMKLIAKISGGDALRGHTRSHTEHDG